MILAAIFVGCLAFKSSLAFPQPLNIAHSPSSSLKVLKSKVKLVPAQNTDKDPVYGILSLVETSEGVYIQVRLLSSLAQGPSWQTGFFDLGLTHRNI